MRLLFILLFSLPSFAQLLPLDETALEEIQGAGAVRLSGDVQLNSAGGPANGSRGARIAVQADSGGAWFVIDDLKGSFSFAGMEISTANVTEGIESRSVIKIGLPGQVGFDTVTASIGVNNNGGELTSAAANNSKILFSTYMDGNFNINGDLLIWGAP